MTLLATLDRLWEPEWDPIRNYQTVSPRTRVNRGRKGILRTSARVLMLVASGTSETASFGKEDTKRCTGTTLRAVLLRR